MFNNNAYEIGDPFLDTVPTIPVLTTKPLPTSSLPTSFPEVKTQAQYDAWVQKIKAGSAYAVKVIQEHKKNKAKKTAKKTTTTNNSTQQETAKKTTTNAKKEDNTMLFVGGAFLLGIMFLSKK